MNTNKNTQFVKKKLEEQKKLQTCALLSHFQIVFYWTKLEFSKTDHQSHFGFPPGLIGDYAWDKARGEDGWTNWLRLENPVRRRLIGVPVNCEKLIKVLNFQSI